MQEKLEQRIQYLDPNQGVEERTKPVNPKSSDNGLSRVIDTDLEEIDLTIRELEKNPFEELRWHLKERPTYYDVVNEIGKKTLRGTKQRYRSLAESLASSDTYRNTLILSKGVLDGYFFIPTYMRNMITPKPEIQDKEFNIYCSGGFVPIATFSCLLIPTITMALFGSNAGVTALVAEITSNLASGLYEIGRKIYLSQKKELEKKCSYDLNEDNNKKD